MAEHIKTALKRWEVLKAQRSPWMQHWDNLARVHSPRRSGFVTSVVEGRSRTDTLFDGTGMQAARGLANTVGGMLRPEGEPWHFIRAAEDDDENTDEAGDWFGDTDQRMRDAFDEPRARMRQAAGEIDLDLVVLGTGVMFEIEGGDLNHLFLQSLHLKDAAVFFAESGAPEGVFRSRMLTLRQAETRFGLNVLSEDSRRKIGANELDHRVEFLHAVVPRKEGRKDAFLARNLPWADLWIEIKEEKEVATGGFHEFPFIVPRWDTSSGEDYGRSPGMIALPDTNTAQAIGETVLIAGQRSADPPLAVPDDSTFDAPNTQPGGLAYYDVETAKAIGRIPIAPIDTGANMPLTRDIQQDTREQIRNAFFRNVFNLPVFEGEKMTATEIIQRREEMIREIGPVFGRLEADYTAPMVERAFNIMLRAGALAPIPEALLGRSVRFEYESPVKKIRQQVQAAAARLWVEEMIKLGEARPEALDLINVDAFGRFGAEAATLPHEIVNGADEVARIRQERAKAQQAAAQLEQLQQGVDTAAAAASIPGVKDALEGAAA